LEGFVVGELNERWLWGEERLIYINLGIDVDGVVSDVKELNDFRLWVLFNYAFS
jgi:hypothetical protein